MGKKIVAIIGTYRKGGITDQAVDAILEAARQKGAEAEKIYLTEKCINFCSNCRVCTEDDPQKKRGRCILNDDMAQLLDKIDAADGLVLASPINFSTVTAIMKRFVERLIVYTYWPWQRYIPKWRLKKKDKKAVVVTSSSSPAFIGRFLMPNALQVLKAAAETVGAKCVKSIYLGGVCLQEKQQLNKKQIGLAESAGNAIAGS